MLMEKSHSATLGSLISATGASSPFPAAYFFLIFQSSALIRAPRLVTFLPRESNS